MLQTQTTIIPFGRFYQLSGIRDMDNGFKLKISEVIVKYPNLWQVHNSKGILRITGKVASDDERDEVFTAIENIAANYHIKPIVSRLSNINQEED